MIAHTEIIDGTLYPTSVDDDMEMEETYRELAAQNDEANDGDEESVGESEDGTDEEALHGSGWMFWNVVGKSNRWERRRKWKWAEANCEIQESRVLRLSLGWCTSAASEWGGRRWRGDARWAPWTFISGLAHSALKRLVRR